MHGADRVVPVVIFLRDADRAPASLAVGTERPRLPELWVPAMGTNAKRELATVAFGSWTGRRGWAGGEPGT